MINLNNNFFEKYRYLIFFVITGSIALSTWITNPIFDSNYLFHEGEYVGLLHHMLAFYNNAIEFPLLIHGAMDFIPSIAASGIYGDNHVIVGTRAINTILVWLCWILFFDLCYSMVLDKANQRIIWMVFITAIFFIIAPRFNSPALLIQQSFLGARDIFLILSIWCFVKFSDAIDLMHQRLFLIAGTCSAVAAFFWSYDRGIIAITFLFVMFVESIIKKAKINSLLILISATSFLAFVQYLNIAGSLKNNIDNIYYWITNSKELFGTSFLESGYINLITAALLIIFCIGAIFFTIKDWSKSTDKYKAIVVGLVLVQILLLQTILNRPGMPRLSWAIWPSILMMLFITSRKFTVSQPFKYDLLTASLNFNLAYKFLLSILLLLVFFMSPLILSYGSFIKNLIRPKSDLQIVSLEIINLSSAINQLGDKCVLGWINEGVVALIAKKRFCTRYPYAIYVSKSEEGKLLQQIIKESPNVIVFDVEGDSMVNVDNRSMSSRLPNVDKFILDNYKNRQNIGRYLIASKSL